MERLKKLKPLFYEFVRYCIVGGCAFLIDAGMLALMNQFVLPEMGGARLYVATAIGFFAGLTFNYFLSIFFVFKAAKERRAGRSFGAFLVFAVVGGIGFGLTELGMYVGVELIGIHYMLVKVIVTGIVLIWNYLGRKVFIFK
jgi:putative flippase GtrA